jgi:hypothetical protein
MSQSMGLMPSVVAVVSVGNSNTKLGAKENDQRIWLGTSLSRIISATSTSKG